jgi:hypothetical protein
VAEAELAQSVCVGVAGVGGAVVVHAGAHLDAAGGVSGDRAAEEGDRAGGGEVVEYFGVGAPGVIVDGQCRYS